ncbi:MAG TPA: hypothetical protein VKB39_08820, partial [Candidatus Baltobacteraceae bacterium]|nr:hypothetical protein [Candidatus Baltobacteraceae bacterium]
LKISQQRSATLTMMAPPVSAAKPASLTVAPRHWGEREVRRMLRGLRRPHRLETEPLANFLCHTYGIERPYDACLRLIREALLDKGLVGKRLYDLIRICDVDATDTMLATASEMGVSERQFFRYRREAIVALAAHANALGAAHPPQTSAVEELARLLSEIDPTAGTRVYGIAHATDASRLQRIDAALNAGIFPDDAALDELHGTERVQVLLKTAATAYMYGNARAADAIVDAVRAQTAATMVEDREMVEYTLANVEYIRTLHRQNATRTRQIARELLRAAQGDDQRTIGALLMQAESDLRCGELELAEQAMTAVEDLVMPRKQLRLVCLLVVGRAALAFMRGELEAAYAYAQSALTALADRRLDAMTLNAFVGRISLQLGIPWRATPELVEIVEPPVRLVSPVRGGHAVALDGSTRRLFQRLYLKCVDLRAQIAGGKLDAIDDIVDTLALARQTGYAVLESMTLATLAHWSDRSGAHDEAQHHAVAAWNAAVEAGDAFLWYDLFECRDAPVREFGAIDLDRAFFEAFYGTQRARFGAIPLVTAPGGAEKDAFWRTTLLCARNSDAQPDANGALLWLSENEPAPESIAKQRTPFIRAVVRETAILLPAGERAAFGTRLRRSLELVFERFRCKNAF